VKIMRSFGIHARFQGPFDEAVAKVTEALRSEGFGVLTEIDIQATLAKKLGVDFRRYKILGACNPPFAHRALERSLDVGLLLPCNVAIYEEGDGGSTHVAAIDPLETLAARGEPALAEIAREVHEKLERVIARVGERVEAEVR
jgi:uncharacterized protein (DUF302 family)